MPTQLYSFFFFFILSFMHKAKTDTETNFVVIVIFTTKVNHQTTAKIWASFSKLSDDRRVCFIFSFHRTLVCNSLFFDSILESNCEQAEKLPEFIFYFLQPVKLNSFCYLEKEQCASGLGHLNRTTRKWEFINANINSLFFYLPKYGHVLFG